MNVKIVQHANGTYILAFLAHTPRADLNTGQVRELGVVDGIDG